MTAHRLCQVLAALVAAPLAVSGCGGGDLGQTTATETRQGAVHGDGTPLAFHGGGGGTTTYNIQPLSGEHVNEFRIWGNVYVDAMQVVYQSDIFGIYRVSSKAGGNGGNFQSLILQPGRYLTSVNGRSASWIDQLCVVSDGGASLCNGAGGGYMWGPDAARGSNQIAGVKGKFGSYIDSLTFWYYAP